MAKPGEDIGYLPNLKHGQTLKTKAGGELKVSVTSTTTPEGAEDGDFYINGAKIVKANLVLDNGVAHIVEKVCPLSSKFFFSRRNALTFRLVGLERAAAGCYQRCDEDDHER